MPRAQQPEKVFGVPQQPQEPRSPSTERPSTVTNLPGMESPSSQTSNEEPSTDKSPPSTNENEPRKVTAEEARSTVALTLESGLWVTGLDKVEPLRDSEIEAVTQSAVECLPAWVFNPWWRFVSSTAYVFARRAKIAMERAAEEKRRKQQGVVVDAAEPLSSSANGQQ